ncbi:coiled-coil domain-containing protein 12 [Fopius arisanus]|uniref:Coiled-coil domain-containing protein 12 n=1 Tax=Fopius arisanus TaxID=64838 RepID=A0A9R1U994_9HYME|nr:PREDICTED: coiled-coil domain-containing protein 12 [Fopius arisanus]XP_011312117.1 PREDICTED: coiled-coil domain-containing protein 12 [Fopius arisanus]
MNEKTVGTLEEEALKRKERLAELKKKKDHCEQKNTEQKTNLPKPRFRSYKPQDENLKEHVLETGISVELEKENPEEGTRSKAVIEELDIGSLAPRKPDWDLKRDVSKKLEKLERRTQKAIAELIIERIKKDKEDIAGIVTLTGNSSINDK